MSAAEQRPIRRDGAVEALEHELHVDLEALAVQMRALGDGIGALAQAIEAMSIGLHGTIPPDVRDHLEKARWSLGELW